MASAFPQMSGDARRHYPSGSARFENRQPVNRSTPCKNGPLCRKYQEGTCPYNHDFSSLPVNGLNVPKKSFNVESPSFTPKSPTTHPAEIQQARRLGISPKAATAAAFTPRSSGTATPASASHTKVSSNEFVPQQPFQSQQPFQEFVPQNFVPQQQTEPQPQSSSTINAFADTFLNNQGVQSFEAAQQQLHPYVEQTATVGGPTFFPDTTQYKHPLNYHLYASIGPRREQLSLYQRATADFFIPDELREDLQRKAETALQVFPNSTLPQNVDNHFHSLVVLDNINQRTATSFGYPSWTYKATSSIDGNIYALRRIEGFRLTSEQAINTKHIWKKVSNANVVRVHDAFTTQAFGDRSLIVVTDYHPQSQPLADKHFARQAASGRIGQVTQEHDLWGYIVQLANAIKSIHAAGLAARCIMPSKVLFTSKNRIRLNGCAVLDILQFDQQRSTLELQQADLLDLGRLILCIAARNPTAHNNTGKSLELVSRTYTDRLRACIQWLLSPPSVESLQDASLPPSDYNIHTLLVNIADQVMSTFDSTLYRDDELTSTLMRELENGRLVRLLTKINIILERPESTPPNSNQASNLLNQPSSAWSETGERYYLKLFRDYVFHQVDHEGRPVLDLGHIITCLNKLEAGIDEKIQLVSRDEQNLFIVSYKEVKRGFEAAWGEISRSAHPGRR